MSKLEPGFKFCACEEKANWWVRIVNGLNRMQHGSQYFRKNRKEHDLHEFDRATTTNTWQLVSREYSSSIVGKFIQGNNTQPSITKEEDPLAAAAHQITDALNTRHDCFDFEYEPMHDDLLRIKLPSLKMIELAYNEQKSEWFWVSKEGVYTRWFHSLLKEGVIQV